MTVFYFTSIGNCLAVAKQFGGNLASIPQVIDSPDTHCKDDVKNRRHLQAKANIALRILATVLSVVTKTDKNAQSYMVNEQCNKCGICAKVCPNVRNAEIRQNNNKATNRSIDFTQCKQRLLVYVGQQRYL